MEYQNEYNFLQKQVYMWVDEFCVIFELHGDEFQC